MIYILLFCFEVLILWRLSRRVSLRLYNILPAGVFALLFLPGTFIHEMSHFLMAKLLFVRVGKFNILPKQNETEIVLGSVSIEKKDAVRRLLIGVSPVFVGICIVLLLVYWSVSREVYKDWRVAFVITYVVFVIGNTMFSSRQDLEGAWKVGIVAAIFIAIAYALGIRIHIDSDFEIVKFACLYLLVPIVIDAILLLLTNKYNILNYGRKSE